MTKVCRKIWVRVTALVLAVLLGMITIGGITLSVLNAEVGTFTSDQDRYEQLRQERQKKLMKAYAYDMVYQLRHNKENAQAQKFEKYKNSNMNYIVYYRQNKNGRLTSRKVAGYGSIAGQNLGEGMDSSVDIQDILKEDPSVYCYQIDDDRQISRHTPLNSLWTVLMGSDAWETWRKNGDGGSADPERIKRVLYNPENSRFYFQTKHYVFAASNIALKDPDENGEFSKNYAYVDGVGYCNHADGKKLAVDAKMPWKIEDKEYDFFYIEGVRITKSLIQTVDAKTMPKVTNVKYLVQEHATSQYYSIYQDYADYYKDDDLATVIVDKDYTQVDLEPQEWVSFAEDTSKEQQGSGYVIYASVRETLSDNGVDLMLMQSSVLDMLYRTHAAVLIVTIICGVLALALVIFYWACVGMKGRQEAVFVLHKVPFILYEGVLATIWGLALGAYISAGYVGFQEMSSGYIGWLIAAAAVLALALMITTIWAVGEFIARVRDGIFWKYSLAGMLFHPVKTLCRHIVKAVGMIPRISLAYIGISVLQTIVIICFSGYETAALFSLFVLYKIVEVILLVMVVLQVHRVRQGASRMAQGDLDYEIETQHLLPTLQEHAADLNQIREGANLAAQQRMKSERFKTELITNVSHDLKTPLTSVINYIDLLQKEDVTPEKQAEYLKVLERQAHRLKKLMQDLLDASKAASGAVELDLQELDLQVLMVQAVGEYQEKMEQRGLDLMISQPEESVLVKADSRQLWRVFDNVLNNICKYALPNTRVYIDETKTAQGYQVTFRNISSAPLNISSDELMERFVRGDSSRHTEGSGLGLSIAKNLMELMGGHFEIQIDGDLFKVILTF